MSNIDFYNSLLDFKNKAKTRMHMPAHKGIDLHDFIENILDIDLTELDSVDSLYHPHKELLKAQQQAAETFGAKKTYFLVNGATVGIIASILTTVTEGDEILIPRNAHKSVNNAIILSGANPVYLMPEVDFEHELTLSYENNLEKTLMENPKIKAIVITYPNFYGFCSDIKTISDIAKKYNKLLIVDEAIGSHFAFSNHLPITSNKVLSDIVVHGTHKNLTSLTQSAMLHVNSDKVDIRKLELYLSMLQSSSPSYVLLASLDLARDYAQNYGKQLYDKLYIDICNLRLKIKDHCPEIIILNDVYYGDFTKLVLNFNNFSLDGQHISDILFNEFKLQTEFYNCNNVLLTFTLADDSNKVKYILDTIKGLYSIILKYKTEPNIIVDEQLNKLLKLKPEPILSPKEAFNMKYMYVGIEHAVGKVSKENINSKIYSMPIIRSGEVFTSEIIDYMKKEDIKSALKIII